MRFSPLDSSDDFMGRGGSVFLYLLQFPSYDVINDVIMSDADCTPGREPRSVAASVISFPVTYILSFLRLSYIMLFKCRPTRPSVAKCRANTFSVLSATYSLRFTHTYTHLSGTISKWAHYAATLPSAEVAHAAAAAAVIYRVQQIT